MKLGLIVASAALLLAGCQSNVQYSRIGYGPELHVAKAQCDIMSMSTEQGMIAWGSPEYVFGAEVGNAIANEIRKQQFMKNCMIIKGWGQAPAGSAAAKAMARSQSKPIKGKGPFPPAPKI